MDTPKPKIGYKATYDFVCRNQKYEVGTIYELNYPPIICYSGFHYCKIMRDVLHYYGPKPNFVLLEIEDLSTETQTLDDKSCTNKMKILRVIPREEYEEFDIDENGKFLHFKDSTGYEKWQEYNLNGKLIHHKDSTEFEYWREYDSNGQYIKTCFSLKDHEEFLASEKKDA